MKRPYTELFGDWQEMMKKAPDVPNVVQASSLENRQNKLDTLLEQLEICEKALQVQRDIAFDVHGGVPYVYAIDE